MRPAPPLEGLCKLEPHFLEYFLLVPFTCTLTFTVTFYFHFLSFFD